MGDERVLGYSLNRIGNYLINVERPDASLENHHQALDIFQRLEDEAGIAETMDFLGLSYALSGDIRKGVDYLDQALALFERLENLYGQVTSMATRTATATGYQTDTMPSVGLKTDEGVRIAERALQTAEKIGWGSGIAYGCCSISIGWLGMGEFDRALQMANRARATADQMKHRQWEAFSRLAQGLVYAELFAYDRAIEIMQPGLTLALESYSLHWTHALAGSITRAMIGKGDIDQAEQFLDRHFPLDAPARMLSERLCWCTRAELEIEKGNPERALAIAKKMVDEVRNMEDGTVIRRVWLLRARSLLELAQKSRDVEDCRRLLGQAADLTAALLNEAQQLGYAVILWRASVLLAKIFDAAGRQQDAKEQRKNAREYVLELSGKISDRELQQQFLNKSFEIIGG
jgi:tetratricopeptide (TPR) repeat protein